VLVLEAGLKRLARLANMKPGIAIAAAGLLGSA
jgi:hypothetical protein